MTGQPGQPTDLITFTEYITAHNITIKFTPSQYSFSPSTGKIYAQEYGIYREMKPTNGGASNKLTASEPRSRVYVNLEGLRKQLGFQIISYTYTLFLS
jgi:hypothetical protein